MKKGAWSDLSSKRRAPVIGLGAVQLGWVGAAHADLSGRLLSDPLGKAPQVSTKTAAAAGSMSVGGGYFLDFPAGR